MTSQQNRLALYNENKFKLGVFGANCSSGRTVTTIPDRWPAEWEDCKAVATIADDAGIDFILPIGRWKGFGGLTDYQGSNFETVTWATGILATTKRVTVFGTVHVPLIHPIIAAKEIVTADHIGQGRFGLNIICGWNEDEFEMFGMSQREHEDKYAYAQEWITAVCRMWSSEDDFDVSGKYFDLKKIRAKPKPFRGSRPIIMNAGASIPGRDFAVRNCDAYFTAAPLYDLAKCAENVRATKAAGAAYNRNVEVYTIGNVTCRRSKKEAVDYYRYCVEENADWGAVDSMLALKNVTPGNMSKETFEKARTNTANGFGQVILVGDPDDVASMLIKLSEAGVAGIAISFVNYLKELPYFCDEVLPRLERAGLRC